MSFPGYVQIGGFGANTSPWCTVTTGKGDVYKDNDKLAEIICGPLSPLMAQIAGGSGDAKVELILGIMSSGASYLLMTEAQMHMIARKSNRHPLRPGRHANDFVSLSPIEFRSVEELEKKLGRYTIKSKSKLKGMDCSPANNRFVIGGGERPGRGAFEHARVFYRVLKQDLELGKFGLVSDSWARSIRMISLVFNAWNADTRPSKERLLRPKLLDIGWSEVGVPDLNVKEGKSVHIMLAEHRTFGLKGKKKSDFEHGDTEMLDHGSISQRLQQFWETVRGPNSQPIVLLVNHAEATMNMLKYFGVDTSNFILGVQALLHGSQRSHRSEGPSRHRSRSRSPRRQDDHSSSSRRRTPPPYGSYSRTENHPTERTSMSSEQHAPVYIMDIRDMTQNVMDSGDLNAYSEGKLDTLSQILHVHYPLTGWCAGNESRELVSLWKSMASGPAIDEQRAIREKADVSAPVPGPSRQGMEEDDPNDYLPAVDSGAIGYGAFDDVWDDDDED